MIEKRTMSGWMKEYVTNKRDYILYKKVMDLHRAKFPKWSKQVLTREQFRKFQQRFIFNNSMVNYITKVRKKTRTRKKLWTIGTKGKIIDPPDAVFTGKLKPLKVF